MPWLALDYTEREFKDILSEAFEVDGIPTLVFLNPITGEINQEGRKLV